MRSTSDNISESLTNPSRRIASDHETPEAPRSPGSAQTCSDNPGSEVQDIERAIARVTRLLGVTEDDERAATLVAERAALRRDLAAVHERAAGVVRLDSRRVDEKK